MSEPRVAAIVLSYNGKDVTLQALPSLLAMTYPSFAKTMQAKGYYLLYGIPGDDTHFQLSTIGDLTDDHVSGIERVFSSLFTS